MGDSPHKTNTADSVALIHRDASAAASIVRLLASDGIDCQLFHTFDSFTDSDEPCDFSCVIIDTSIIDEAGFSQLSLCTRGSRHLPVIAISKVEDPQARLIARRSGVSAFFREPLDGEALIDALRWAFSENIETHQDSADSTNK